MSLRSAPRRRSLLRAAAVGAVVAASGSFGAPAASAAEDDRPVIALDPPDSFTFLVPAEDGDLLDLTEGMAAAASGDGAVAAPEDGAAAAATLAEAASALPPDSAAALPPELAAALGAEGELTTQTHGPQGGVHVLHGGRLDLQLPRGVDARSAVLTLEVDPRDAATPPLRYASDPTSSDQPLSVTSPAAGRFALTLPGPVPGYRATATLTVGGLTDTATGAELSFPLVHGLRFTSTAPDAVELRPLLAVLARAGCSVHVEELCPGPTVRAGKPVDLAVPTGSLLPSLGLGQLDSAWFVLGPVEEAEPYAFYDSLTNPGLVTVHRPRAATLHVPADAPAGPYMGAVMTVDPAVGAAMTFFELDVEGVPVNPGLHSDTGWVDEVREVSPASTAAVAGGALLVVAGLVTVAAVRPVRRPPLEG